MTMLRVRRIIGILILIISLVFLLWGIWPPVTVVRTLPVVTVFESLRTSIVALATSAPGKPLVENAPASVESTPTLASQEPTIPNTPSINSVISTVLENRLLVLEWPPKMRVGDVDILRLTLVMDEQGNLASTTNVAGNDLRNELLIIPNLYRTHNIIVEAHLDMAGMQHTPSGEVSEALHPGHPVMFLWNLLATAIGTYRGTVWLHLRFVPLDGEAELRSVFSTQLVEIEVVDFLGLGGTAARVLGSVGIVVGSMMGLDGLLAHCWSFFKSLRKSGSNV